jgi:hypothetical protein
MNTELKTAITSTSLSLGLGLVSLYLCLWVLKNQYVKKKKIAWQTNYFFAIITLGVLIGTGIIISGIIPSISTILKLYFRPDNIVSDLDLIKFCSFELLLCIMFVLIINYGSKTITEALLGKLDIKDEENSTRDNIYALIIAGMFIALAIIMKESGVLITEMLIPYSRL